MKIFFDVDGVLIRGRHAKPEHRRPWDTTIEQDLGVSRDAFQQQFFRTPTGGFESFIHACANGNLDLKVASTEMLSNLHPGVSVDQFVEYWFAKDSIINEDVLGAVTSLAQHSHVALYLATGQEHYRADYLWHRLGFAAHFKDIFYSSKLGQAWRQAMHDPRGRRGRSRRTAPEARRASSSGESWARQSGDRVRRRYPLRRRPEASEDREAPGAPDDARTSEIHRICDAHGGLWHFQTMGTGSSAKRLQQQRVIGALPGMDLSRFDSGSATHLSGLLFEGQGAFTSQS